MTHGFPFHNNQGDDDDESEDDADYAPDARGGSDAESSSDSEEDDGGDESDHDVREKSKKSIPQPVKKSKTKKQVIV